MLFIDKKISRRLFSGLLLVAVVPICIMDYGIYKIVQKVVLRSACTQIETVKMDHEHHLSIWFKELLNDIRIISQLPCIRELCGTHKLMGENDFAKTHLPDLAKKILIMTRAKSPSYKSMNIFSTSGEILASTDPHSDEILNFDHQALFDAALKTGEPVLGPAHQHSDQMWYMSLAAPIKTQEGEIIAYALAVLDASATLDPNMKDRFGLGKTGEAYVVSRNRQIITESRFLSRSETVDRVFSTEGIDMAIAGKRGTGIYTNYMGRKVIGSYTWLPQYNWAILVEMGEDEILSPMKTIRTALILTTAAVGVLSLLLALFMSRRVSLPIIRVAEASHEISEGHFEQRIPYSGTDEIAVLSRNFNSMAEKLANMITSLRHKEASLQKAYEELLEIQQQLIQSEKMAAVGELVTSVVHEMRNPLSSVKLNLQIIGRTLEKKDLLAEHYQIAIDQVSQLEKMFTDLLNYSKPFNLQKGLVSIDRLVDESLLQLQSLISCRATTISRKLGDNLPPLWADADKMRQVLVNVVKNAIEATGQEGSIEITGHVKNHNGKNLITIAVTDNGTGISSQDLKRIFQPFFTTKKKGTGLGLPIVKKIMEAHGYKISVSSEEAKGTVVRLKMQGAETHE